MPDIMLLTRTTPRLSCACELPGHISHQAQIAKALAAAMDAPFWKSPKNRRLKISLTAPPVELQEDALAALTAALVAIGNVDAMDKPSDATSAAAPSADIGDGPSAKKDHMHCAWHTIRTPHPCSSVLCVYKSTHCSLLAAWGMRCMRLTHVIGALPSARIHSQVYFLSS